MTEQTETRQKGIELSVAYQQAFDYLYKLDTDVALWALPTTFIMCYQKLPPELRLRVIHAIFTLAKDIGNELFEDGLDFVSFISLHKKYEGKKEAEND